MTATIFNPLEAVRGFEAAGVERRQAEATAEGMRRAAIADHGPFATKADTATLFGRGGRYPRGLALAPRAPRPRGLASHPAGTFAPRPHRRKPSTVRRVGAGPVRADADA